MVAMTQYSQASGGGGGTAGAAVPRNLNEIMGVRRGRDRWDVIRTAANAEAERQGSLRGGQSAARQWKQRRAGEKAQRFLGEKAQARGQ
jgi:hypothetical protein